MAKCCTPVPGDEIAGYISLGKGITIHRLDCPNVKALMRNPERFTSVEWDGGASQSFRVQIAVVSWDRPRLLEDVARTFAEHGTNIVEYGGHVEDQMAKNWYVAEVGDIKALRALLGALAGTSSRSSTLPRHAVLMAGDERLALLRELERADEAIAAELAELDEPPRRRRGAALAGGRAHGVFRGPAPGAGGGPGRPRGGRARARRGRARPRSAPPTSWRRAGERRDEERLAAARRFELAGARPSLHMAERRAASAREHAAELEAQRRGCRGGRRPSWTSRLEGSRRRSRGRPRLTEAGGGGAGAGGHRRWRSGGRGRERRCSWPGASLQPSATPSCARRRAGSGPPGRGASCRGRGRGRPPRRARAGLR